MALMASPPPDEAVQCVRGDVVADRHHEPAVVANGELWLVLRPAQDTGAVSGDILRDAVAGVEGKLAVLGLAEDLDQARDLDGAGRGQGFVGVVFVTEAGVEVPDVEPGTARDGLSNGVHFGSWEGGHSLLGCGHW